MTLKSFFFVKRNKKILQKVFLFELVTFFIFLHFSQFSASKKIMSKVHRHYHIFCNRLHLSNFSCVSMSEVIIAKCKRNLEIYSWQKFPTRLLLLYKLLYMHHHRLRRYHHFVKNWKTIFFLNLLINSIIVYVCMSVCNLLMVLFLSNAIFCSFF